MRTFVVALAVVTLVPAVPARAAQRPDSLGAQVKEYVRVDTAALALTHVLVIDGTGSAPRPDQTVVIHDGKIAEIGPAQTVRVPAASLEVVFAEGETIWTESSYKYQPQEFSEVLERAGFGDVRQWLDEQDGFALTLAEAI